MFWLSPAYIALSPRRMLLPSPVLWVRTLSSAPTPANGHAPSAHPLTFSSWTFTGVCSTFSEASGATAVFGQSCKGTTLDSPGFWPETSKWLLPLPGGEQRLAMESQWQHTSSATAEVNTACALALRGNRAISGLLVQPMWPRGRVRRREA